VAGLGENGSKTLRSIKSGEVLVHLSDYKLLKKDLVPLSYLIRCLINFTYQHFTQMIYITKIRCTVLKSLVCFLLNDHR
jgi:hypothetical protein